MNGQPLVRLEDFWAGFRRPGGTHYVFRGANLEIRQGDLACLVGPSGSGKTVFLNLLIGAMGPGRHDLVLQGTLEVLGRSIVKGYPEALVRQMGIVFQESALFEDLSTMENAGFGLRCRGTNPKERAEKVLGLLKAVGLHDPPRRVTELSGGQKKRLALARTLALEPSVLIYDEPTSGLDPNLCHQIADLIKETHDGGGGARTTLVVTHDYQAVLPIASRAFLIDPERGAIDEVKGAGGMAERMKSISAVRPRLEKEGAGRMLFFGLKKVLGLPLRWMDPVSRFLSRPVPGSRRQSLLRLGDTLVLPCLYICAAGAVLGGISTFFALENNPLKGAMDRQAIIGLGKVLMAIVVPLMTAVLFAARVGAGTAARLGNIRLGRQDEALRMLGSDPGGYLITPLFWACLIGLPLLTIPVCVSAGLTSLFCACTTRPITPFGWASAFFEELYVQDLLYATIKQIGSGGLVAAVAACLGLKDKNGAEDLGRDVTGTIVGATFLVILWHGALTLLQYA